MDVGAVFSSFARGWPSKKPAVLAHKVDLETEPSFRPYQGQPTHTGASLLLLGLGFIQTVETGCSLEKRSDPRATRS